MGEEKAQSRTKRQSWQNRTGAKAREGLPEADVPGGKEPKRSLPLRETEVSDSLFYLQEIRRNFL